MPLLGPLHGTSLLTKVASIVAFLVLIQVLLTFQAILRLYRSTSIGVTSCKLNRVSNLQTKCDAKLDNFNVTLATDRHLYRLYKPSCVDLISGDESEIERAIVYGIKYPAKKINLNYTTCRQLKRDYIFKITEEEYDFPLAYGIVAYKNMKQFKRLLRAIYRPSNFYCIHVHAKANPTVITAMRLIAKCFRNVFISSTRIDVQEGNASALHAHLACMQDLLNYSGWKYMMNLAGKEFPLKTNVEIIRILNVQNGKNVVDVYGKLDWDTGGHPPHNLTLYTGNPSVVVRREFVQYAVHNAAARDFLKWVHTEGVPYETFFATLNQNPHLNIPGSLAGPADTDYEKKPHLVQFKNGKQRSGLSIRCRGVRRNGVCVFGVGDLSVLTSRREMFGSMFDSTFQPQTFDCIEEWLRNRTKYGLKKIGMDSS